MFSQWIKRIIFQHGVLRSVAPSSTTFRLESLEDRTVPAHYFAPAIPMSDDAYVGGMALADFNEDGYVDSAVACLSTYQNPAHVSVLIGNGNGTFAPGQQISLDSPLNVISNDFNHDAHADIVVLSSDDIRIYLGAGDGTFEPGQVVDLSAWKAAMADFNDDGNLDLALVDGTDDRKIRLLEGDGAGRFTKGIEITAGSNHSDIASADLNEDGRSDIVVTNNLDHSISILYGTGSAEFGPAVTIAVNGRAASLAIADFNADDNLDLAIACFGEDYANTDSLNEQALAILLGTNDGIGTSISYFAGPQLTWPIAAADFDGDEKVDIALGGILGAAILKGDGNGAFDVSVNIGNSVYFASVAPADVNSDGLADLVASLDGRPSVLLNYAYSSQPIVQNASYLAEQVINNADQTIELTVTFQHVLPLDAGSIGVNDLTIVDDTGRSLSVRSAEFRDSGVTGRSEAVYSIGVPAGWSEADNGRYTASLRPDQVKDSAGNAVAELILGVFDVSVDTIVPTVVSVTAPDVTARDQVTFSVRYSDDQDLYFATDAVTITGPGGVTIPILNSNYSLQSGARTQDFTYVLDLPGGWRDYQNGVYTIRLQDSKVFDSHGNSIPAQIIGTFNVAVSSGPGVSNVSMPPVTDADIGKTSYSVTVTFADADGIDLTSLKATNLVLLFGSAARPADDISVNPSVDSKTVVATYTFAISGGWSQDYNGNMGLRLAWAAPVYDIDGNAGQTGDTLYSVKVDLDSQVPQFWWINASPLGVNSSNDPQTYTFYVYYYDIHFDSTTIDAKDVTVIGPDGREIVPSKGIVYYGGPAGACAQYTIDFPSGWTSDDNGIYQVRFNANEVSDTRGKSLPENAFQLFTLRVDDIAPVVTDVVAPDVGPVYTGSGRYSFVVTYRDDLGIDRASINAYNVAVTAPDGRRLQSGSISSFSANDDSTIVTVGYEVYLHFPFDEAVNGTYTIDLVDPPSDHSHNHVGVQRIATFLAAVDTIPPQVGALAAQNVTEGRAAPTTYSFTVEYTDQGQLDIGSVGLQNVTVVGPAGQMLNVVSAVPDAASNGQSQKVTYTVAVPTGWSMSDNGTYTVKLNGNQVKDTGRNAAAARTLGTFTVAVPAPLTDTTAPSVAGYSFPNATAADAAKTRYSFTITYSDNDELDASTIRANNVAVTGPDGRTMTVADVSINQPGNDAVRTATYAVSIPEGWRADTTGYYTVKLLPNQVKDITGNAAASRTLGTFTVDLTPPAVKSVSLPAVTPASMGQTAYSFTVAYSDNLLVNVGSVGVGNVSVTGPNGQALTVLSATPNAASNGSSRNVVYTVAVPGGWSEANAGTYTVKLNGGQVKDTAGNAVEAKTLGTFKASMDATPPTVSRFSLPNVTQANAGQTTYSFSVSYADNLLLSIASISPSNVSVTGPGGRSLTVVSATPNANSNGSARNVTYTVAVPDGWSDADVGTYSVRVLGGQVKDTAGKAVAAKTIGTFTVDITPPAIKTAVAKNVTGANAGQATYSFTVSFTDNLLLNIASVGVGNVSVTGPNGTKLTVTSATPNAASNGTSRTVTYTVAVPGGWKETSNGAYTIKLLPNQIKDTAGNTIVAQTITAFSVLIPPVVAAA